MKDFPHVNTEDIEGINNVDNTLSKKMSNFNSDNVLNELEQRKVKI